MHADGPTRGPLDSLDVVEAADITAQPRHGGDWLAIDYTRIERGLQEPAEDAGSAPSPDMQGDQ